MIKVGITGQAGFVGTHLFNTLGLYPDKFTRVPFEDNYFQSKATLETFVQECDVIIHLAAMNRHNNPEVLYQTNIGLVNQLIASLEKTSSTPHVLFSSSTQEERDNLYGKSKREGRELLEQWATRNNARFTGLVIPNVFGPFGNPYYNSVIATFCHQLTHNETPRIDVDGEIKLIYVSELVKHFLDKIEEHSVTQSLKKESHSDTPLDKIEEHSVSQSSKKESHSDTPINKVEEHSVSQSSKKESHSDTPLNIVRPCETFYVPHTSEIKVSSLLQKLTTYKENYFEKGTIPSLNDPFDRNLFNTFLTYIDHKSFFPFHLKLNTDERGSFVETVKLNSGGQVSFSTTVPGITRGNHFHTRKAERFAVIKGKALIEIRRIGTREVLSFELDGKTTSFVDMPVWYTHNIKNIGTEELYTIFWINEHFDANDPDTFFEKV